jgi:hypothetical protein
MLDRDQMINFTENREIKFLRIYGKLEIAAMSEVLDQLQ